MSLFGGLVAGAMQGGGEAGVKVGLNEQEALIQEARDARIADLRRELIGMESAARKEEYAARTPVDVEKERQLAPIKEASHRVNAEVDATAAVRKAKESPRTIAAGSTEKIGDETYTAPSKYPQEQLDYWKSLANRNNADAQFIRAGGKDKVEKPVYPKLIKMVDDENKPYVIDQNTGAVGRERIAQPAKESVWRLFKPNEPAQPEVLAGMDWIGADGKKIPGGLPALYKQMAQGPEKSAASESGVDWSKFGAGPPKQESPKEKELPRRPWIIGGEQTTPDIPGGAELDAARGRVKNARAQLLAYGALKRRNDPEGFAAAKRTLIEAQREEERAMSIYQRSPEVMKAGNLRAR